MYLIPIILLLALCIGAWFAYTKLKEGSTFRISAGQINSALEKKFPVEKTHLKIIHTVLDQPRVILKEGEDKVQIEATAHVSAKPIEVGSFQFGTNKTYSATVRIQGAISLEAAEGKFFFTEAELVSVDSEKKVPEKLREPLRKAVSLIAKETFKRVPVYTLKEGERSQNLAKMMLKDVRVENGQVALTIQLPD